MKHKFYFSLRQKNVFKNLAHECFELWEMYEMLGNNDREDEPCFVMVSDSVFLEYTQWCDGTDNKDICPWEDAVLVYETDESPIIVVGFKKLEEKLMKAV